MNSASGAVPAPDGSPAPVGRERVSGVLATLAAITLLLHALVGERYGYFRDELYYLACSNHLAFGYVDHPPLSIAVLWGARHLLGDSLWAIRLPAWLAGAAAVWMTGMLAREIGGGKYAQVSSALCVMIGPVYLGVVHFYSMNALDVLFWTLAAFAFARALSSGRAGWWIALGVILGLGLENKISILWLGAGIGAALVLTPARAWLWTRWPWVAATIALALFVPHVAWQVQNGWPTLEFIRNATARKMSPVSPLEFLANQILVQHPITLPVWSTGVAFLFWRSSSRPDLHTTRRALGLLFVVPALILLTSGTARANYLSPAFPIVFAGGAVAIETLLRGRRLMRGAVLGALVVAGVVTAPAGLPLLPVEQFIRYAQALKLAPRAEEKIGVGLLPQHYADQFGWPELAKQVSDVYHGLPEAERARCAIFGSNYGRAGAIDFFGRDLGLPRAISGHNNYFLWGPRGYSGECVIIIGGKYDDHAPDFEEVRQVGRVSCRYCMPYEDGAAIFLCRRAKAPLPAVWPYVKDYI